MEKNRKNSGMFLESKINQTIKHYLQNNLAIFHKMPIPIKIRKITNHEIKSGFITNKSTVDYFGLYKGKFIAFEVKSTIKSHFFLTNIKHHQATYLANIMTHHGIAFYIIGFESARRYFIIEFHVICQLKIKSITVDDALLHGYEIQWILPEILDFLPIIDFLILNVKKMPS